MENKKKYIEAAQWVLVAFVAVFALVLALSNFNTPLKIRIFSVNSGSMEPALKLGSLVIVRPQDVYYVGDIITYKNRRDPKETTTHRIVKVNNDPDIGRTTFVTKGDANEDEDAGLTLPDQLVGKVVLALPLLGYLVSFVKTQLGFTFLIVIPATIIIYGEVQQIRTEVAGAIAEKKKGKEAEKKGVKEESEKVQFITATAEEKPAKKGRKAKKSKTIAKKGSKKK